MTLARGRAYAAIVVVCLALSTASGSSAAQSASTSPEAAPQPLSADALFAANTDVDLDRVARTEQRESSVPAPSSSGTEPDSQSVVVAVDAAPTTANVARAALNVSGIPAAAQAAYQAAERRLAQLDPACHLSWSLLAGIGKVESNHARLGGARLTGDGVAVPPIRGPRLDGTGAFALIGDSDGGRFDGDTEYDRAVGPMQFLPATWRGLGLTSDPQDIDEATVAAGLYLCSGSGSLRDPERLRQAVWRYNHSWAYVDRVLALAAAYALDANPLSDSPAAEPSPVRAAPRSPAAAPIVAAALPAAPAPPPTPQLPPSPEPSPPTPPMPPSTPTPTPSVTSTPDPTATPTPTPTPTSPPTSTPTPTPTPTPEPTPTPTPTACATATPTPTPTPTPTGTATATPVPTPEATPSPAPTPTATATPEPTCTATPTPTDEGTPTPTP